jgi:hypothetical protein
MRFIQFTYIPKYGYLEENFSDFGLQKLGTFLIGEVGSDATLYNDWILDPQKSSNFGNFVGISKRGDSIVLYFGAVMDVTDEQRIDWILELNPQDADDEFNMPVKDFLHAIEHWAKIRKMWFKEIWITCENGVYWVEGVE